MNKTSAKDLLKIVALPVFAAGLCCLTPAVLVLLGLSTATFAASLADTLYGSYKWGFRLVGLLLLAGSLIVYFRRKGICTLDQAKRQRRTIINVVLLALVAGALGYMVWLYVVVEYAGVLLGIW